ncbi:malectin domain-containing carbohydrate-binding protein [Flagellimonas eckloniae]|uniref:malectin domain-containing carbohydrate-binding protein n=1 Tax=Flagellimonas eckloniae TaxID=346185 RepID=UPI0006DCEB62|nr:malectin domain-containing carbohydrate-binding protein [Allomuricauda eckloniae]
MKVILKIVFLFFCGSIIAQTNLSLRVNAGGPQLTHNGDVFLADQYSVSGSGWTTTNGQSLDALYVTERWGDQTLSYEIPVDNGTYDVILHFAELWYHGGEIGSRVFDVSMENQLVLDNYDINADIGPLTAVEKAFVVSVTDGFLSIYFSSLPADGGANNPKVSAIEVLGTNNTDTQSPTTPTLSSATNTDTTVDLSWSGATDNIAVTGYKIYKDGALEATLGNVSTYQVTGLTASTAYNFTATALDAAGNESVTSNIVSVTTDSSGGSSGGSTVWSESSGNISYSAGNVGIGTSTIPSAYKLAVNGKIITEELKVQLQSAWPDYVFAKNYDLPSLEEIQKHIDEKGHLPNMPSAKEVEENGIEVGEMNRLLLEKIEELTIYIIAMKKEIIELKNKR